jgi:hypothetical protein
VAEEPAVETSQVETPPAAEEAGSED